MMMFAACDGDDIFCSIGVVILCMTGVFIQSRTGIRIVKWASPKCVIFLDLGVCTLLVHPMFTNELKIAKE